MSYQNIADIISVSQNDFSVKKGEVVDSSIKKYSASASFGELVSFYKEERDVSDPPVENNKISEESKSDVSEDYKNNKSIKTEKTAVQESPDDKSVKKDSESDVKSKKIDNSKDDDSDTEKIEKKASGNQLNNEVVVDDKIKSAVSKEDSEKKLKNVKNKKLSKKDFSHLHEIAGQKIADSDVVENESGKKVANKSKKSNSKSKENNLIQDNKIIDNSNAASEVNINNNSKNFSQGKNNNSESDSVEKKIEKNEKVFLDKDQKIEVQDLRSDAGKAADIQSESKNKFKVSEPKLVNDNTATMTIDLNKSADANVLSSNNQTAAANGSNFQAMLNNQIQQAAPEFVKAGNLVLKDNNQGTINLVLRPDELGNVKLHLSLDGKNISGHITVATKEAMEVFKDNAETLREAFIKNGFDSANFDVAYGGNQGSFNQNMDFEQQDGREVLARRVYENNESGSAVESESSYENNLLKDDYSINIVA